MSSGTVYTIVLIATSLPHSDLKGVKDYRNLFQKYSENLDTALNKNAQVNKNKPTDVVEAENFLAASRSCFQHTTLDYVNSLTMMQAKKKPDLLCTLLSYVKACRTYYHQGTDLCADYDPFFKSLGDEVRFGHLFRATVT